MKDKYDRKAVAPLVLQSMHDGESLRQSCRMAGISAQTFLRWAQEDTELAEQYAHACEARADAMFDEILELADAPIERNDKGNFDPAAVMARRMQIDSRKWELARMAPKKYGDKVEQTIVGDADKPLIINFVEPPVRDDDH